MEMQAKISRMLTAMLLIAASTLTLLACNGQTEPAADTTALNAITTAAPTTTAAPETEPPIPEPALKLTALTFDDTAYSVTLDNNTEYTVTLPAGRSRIPHMRAEAAADVSVEIVDAVIPDGAAEGKGTITLTQADIKQVYTVTFRRDPAAGFHLQYDDRYTFTPDYKLAAGEALAFTSSDPAVATVDEKGLVQILAVSDNGVTITAAVNGKTVDTLKIDRTIKAPLNLFIFAGQSNAEGIKGVAAESIKTAPGTAYYINRATAKINDLCNGRKGFSPSMLDAWYKLTGEKSLAVQTAVDGARIEKWVPTGEHYLMTKSMMTRLLKNYSAADANYEINRVGFLWHHGETDMAKGMDAATYTEKFMQMYEAAKKDWGVSFGIFNIVRSTRSLSLPETVALGTHTDMLPIRAAEYALHNTLPDFTMISRFPESATMTSGLIFTDNVHFSQKGYNALGQDVAENLFNLLCCGADRTPTSLELYAYNGRDKYEDGAVIELAPGERCQIVPIVLPIYNNNKLVTCTVEGSAVTVDDSTMLCAAATAAPGDTATVTVTGGGFQKKLTVKIKESDQPKLAAVSYAWEFNGDLKEASGTTLKLSALSTDPAYTLTDRGTIVITNRITDFDMGMTFTLKPEYAWAIEYKGSVEKCSALFGETQNKNNFIYITPYNSYASFRLVSADGKKIDIPYGKYIDENYNTHVWRVANDPATMTISLSMDGQVIAEKKATDYSVTVSNLFGRYTSGTNVCLQGEIDYVRVETYAEK